MLFIRTTKYRGFFLPGLCWNLSYVASDSLFYASHDCPISLLKNIYFMIKGMRRREGEKHQCVAASQAPPTRELAHKSGVCPDWESNR